MLKGTLAIALAATGGRIQRFRIQLTLKISGGQNLVAMKRLL
jgi:hypothetical protein